MKESKCYARRNKSYEHDIDGQKPPYACQGDVAEANLG